ncbi:calcium-binding protein [Acidovorax sp.]|uniref:beta strand repeat-containing protein n=1 Tax=Acidovorax sp. TaxID=1872122 RepID=UPI002ACEBDD2|nr:calcium-binding protein [Acidovorax sp.]MDZ7863735.1 calcium-binding protein [Acidovorax sp.]
MAVSTQEQKLLIKLVISMLGISPGSAYMPLVEKVYEDLGRSLPDLASALAGLPQFQARYPAGMAGDAFATQFLAGMGLAADTGLHRLAADLFNAGVSPQQIMLAAVQALDSPTLPAQYAAARALLDNKAEVAYYHTQIAGRTETDFAALAKVLENVTQDPASVAAAKLVLDQPASPGAGGGGGPPPVFAVTKGVGDIASFTSAGTQVDVTEAGGTFTFTSSGGSAGTATLTGPLAGIIVPGGTTVAIASALANGKAFSGAGTALVVANAGGEDLTTFTGTGVTGFALTSGQNYTLTAAQAAIGRIGTGGAAGTLTDAGTTSVRDTLAALGGGVAATLKANGADSVIATAAPADISAISVAGIDSIVLAAGNYTMAAAQAALANGTTGTQIVTVTTQASGTLAASIESFVLGNFANSVVLGAPAQNVSSAAGTGTTLAIAGATPTGTWALGHASDDTLVATDGADLRLVNGGAATTADKLTLTGGITMTQAQHEALASIAAPGSSDSVTITNTGTVTARADVETYRVANSSVPNTILITHGATNVTGGSGEATLVVAPGLAVTGNYILNGFSGAINAGNGVNLSGVNSGGATTANDLTINGAISMSQAQHAAFTSVSATGGSDEVSITTGGAVTARSGIETYVLSGGGANTLTALAVATKITGLAAHATTVDVGNLNVLGSTWLLGHTGDTIVASGTNANVSGVNAGAATQAEDLTLTGGITMTQAQHEALTKISAAGSTDFVAIVTGGAVTAQAEVETYTVSSGSSNSVTVLSGTSVNGILSYATTVNVGGSTVTGNYQLGHAADVLVATDGANIVGATTSSVEKLELSGAITMRANQYNQFTGGIAATGNDDRVILNSALGSGETLHAAVESFTLAAFNNSVTLGAAQAINAQALTAGQTLALAGGFAASVALVGGNLTASGATGNLTVTGGAGANTITVGVGNDTVNAGAGADLITGGAGADTLNGEAGNDSFHYEAAADFFTGGAVVDRIDGGADTDSVNIVGAIVLDTASDLTRMTTVEQLQARAQSATANAHSIVVSSQGLLGDLTTIDLSGDTNGTSTGVIDMRGITRDLTLKGVGMGPNSFHGGSGADTIVGGSGNDSFFIDNVAHAANDSVTGGGGNDRVVFASTAGATLVVNDNFSGITSFWTSTGAAGTSTGTTSENINASTRTQGGVTLNGNTGANTLTGTSSADTLVGNGGADVLRGGSGNDTITTVGSAATYVFEATASNNGNDTLDGVLSTGKFDFSGFLGATGALLNAAVDATVLVAGLDLSTGKNIGIRYGSASLGTGDIRLATDNSVAGEVAIANDGKAVIFSFASSSTGNNANGTIYYVEDVLPGVGEQWAVYMVGTMSGSNATILQMVNEDMYL